jgi:hypothetical protein
VKSMSCLRSDVLALLAHRMSRRATKNIDVVGVVTCLAVTGFAAAVHGVGAASGIQSVIVSMADTHKGDRLSPAPKNISAVPSPAVTTLSRPPIGCEPAFSGVSDPMRSHIFGRCIS